MATTYVALGKNLNAGEAEHLGLVSKNINIIRIRAKAQRD